MTRFIIRINNDLLNMILPQANAAGYKNIQKLFNASLSHYDKANDAFTRTLESLYQVEDQFMEAIGFLKRFSRIIKGLRINIDAVLDLMTADDRHLFNTRQISGNIEDSIAYLEEAIKKTSLHRKNLAFILTPFTHEYVAGENIHVRLSSELSDQFNLICATHGVQKSACFFRLIYSHPFVFNFISALLMDSSGRMDLLKGQSEKLMALYQKHSLTIENINSIARELYHRRIFNKEIVSTRNRLVGTLKYLKAFLDELEAIKKIDSHDH